MSNTTIQYTESGDIIVSGSGNPYSIYIRLYGSFGLAEAEMPNMLSDDEAANHSTASAMAYGIKRAFDEKTALHFTNGGAIPVNTIRKVEVYDHRYSLMFTVFNEAYHESVCI